jgi:hypothetical protein
MSSVERAFGVRLSPSLRAATLLERRYGFQTMLDACADGRMSVIADIVEASSDCSDFLATLRGTPLIEVLPKLVEQLPSHILTLAGVDPNSDNTQQSSGETMPFADYYARLFRLGTGWLGWSPEATWNATPKEITEAYSGHLEMLRAIYGTSEADDQPHPTQPPERAKLDRAGLHAIKRMGALPCR